MPTLSGAHDDAAELEVRRSILDVMVDRLRVEAPVTWHGARFSLSGARLDNASFVDVSFRGGRFYFDQCNFTGRKTTFYNATFDGAHVMFRGAVFSASDVSFESVDFKAGVANFRGAVFATPQVRFNCTTFGGCDTSWTMSRMDESIVVIDDQASLKRLFTEGAVIRSVALWPPEYESPTGEWPPAESATRYEVSSTPSPQLDGVG